MAELAYTIKCPLPGFETVGVTYNMLASEKDADIFSRKAGKDDSADGIVLGVEGWDAKQYGDDPWDYGKSPLGFRVWAARKGFAQAVAEFVNDPNF